MFASQHILRATPLQASVRELAAAIGPQVSTPCQQGVFGGAGFHPLVASVCHTTSAGAAPIFERGISAFGDGLPCVEGCRQTSFGGLPRVEGGKQTSFGGLPRVEGCKQTSFGGLLRVEGGKQTSFGGLLRVEGCKQTSFGGLLRVEGCEQTSSDGLPAWLNLCRTRPMCLSPPAQSFIASTLNL
jgi:hypothetical protein